MGLRVYRTLALNTTMQTQTLPMRCQGEGESGGEERSDLGFFCSGFAGLKKFLTGFPPGCLKRSIRVQL